jgi:hypothetical protein
VAKPTNTGVKVTTGDAYQQCTITIDGATHLFHANAIDSRQYADAVGRAIEEYLRDDDPRDDLDLLIAYARLTVEPLIDDCVGGDRSAHETFDRVIRSYSSLASARLDLDDLLAPIRQHAEVDLAGAQTDLVEICRSGLREHPRIFTWNDLTTHTLRYAHRIGAVSALSAAVHPDFEHDGQICGQWHQCRAIAFNLLGAHSAHPDTGEPARDALIDLAAHPATAGSAICRLPVHLLTAQQRRRLDGLLDSYIELLDHDVYQHLDPDNDIHRVPDLLRGVLWQANDAARFP